MTNPLETEAISNDTTPPRRVVLLGASNVSRSFSTLVDTARQAWGGPLDLLAADGHGRSYGQSTQVLGRRLTSIVDCALWDALKAREAAPTAALVTDIGNDLLYGASVHEIAGWIEWCVDRLLEHDAQIVITRLPLVSLNKLTPLRFQIVRTLLFPKSRLNLKTALRMATELDERLTEIGQSRNISMVEPRESWYGIDPIHLKYHKWPKAFLEILDSWSTENGPSPPARATLRERLYLRRLIPHERHFLGYRQGRIQPSGKLSDGTTIALY